MSDGLFHLVDDVQVILRRKGGVFGQAKVYHRRESRGRKALYAGVGNGFVALYGSGGTSSPNVSWLSLEGTPAGLIEYDVSGRPFST